MRLVDCGYRAGLWFLLFESQETSTHPYYPLWFRTPWDVLHFLSQMRKEANHG